MDAFETTGGVEEMLCERATVNHIPINAILELTPLCNMNCDMCFVRLSPEEMNKHGRLRGTQEWLSLAEEMKQHGTLFVLLTGGEPLLYPGFRTLYLQLRRMGMIVTINTNGTLIDEEWADFFAKHRPRRINITLYGKNAVTYGRLCHYPGGYSKTKNAIRLLKERNVDVKINGSLTPVNLQDSDELIRQAEEQDAVWKIDTYMYPASRERDRDFRQEDRLSPERAAKARVELMRRKLGTEKFCSLAKQLLHTAAITEPGESLPCSPSCRAGRSSFVINWQGKMRPCVMLNGPEISVFETKFDEAWKQLVQETEGIKLSPHCNACTLRDVCNTCAACAFLEGGSFDAVPEYMCQYTKATLRYLEKELRREAENETDM